MLILVLFLKFNLHEKCLIVVLLPFLHVVCACVLQGVDIICSAQQLRRTEGLPRNRHLCYLPVMGTLRFPKNRVTGP